MAQRGCHPWLFLIPEESWLPVFPQGQWAVQQAQGIGKVRVTRKKEQGDDHVFTVLTESPSEKRGANPLYKKANKDIAKTVSAVSITWH